MTQNNETPKPTEWTKRIGSTTYCVKVHFNQSCKEPMQEKLLKLIESEVRKSA